MEEGFGRGVRFNESVQIQKMESVITQSNCETSMKKKESKREKYKKVESVNAQNDYETTSKK